MSGRFGAGDFSCLEPLNGRAQTVASPGHRFDVSGGLGGVAQGLAKDPDRNVDAVVEIHNGVVGPEPLLNRLTSNDLPLRGDQHPEDVERLLLKKRFLLAIPSLNWLQIARIEVKFELPEPNPASEIVFRGH